MIVWLKLDNFLTFGDRRQRWSAFRKAERSRMIELQRFSAWEKRYEVVRSVREGRDHHRVEPRDRPGDRRSVCRGGRAGRHLGAQCGALRGGGGRNPREGRGGD